MRNSPDSATSLATLSSALDSVHAWLTSNRLSVNPSKTEFLIIGTPQQRSKLTATTPTFQGTLLTPTDSTRNLGFIFDKDLSAKVHISSVCKSSYFQICQLRQVRSSLDKNSAIILANSLVSSKLDYRTATPYITIFLLFHLIGSKKFKLLWPVSSSLLLDVTITSPRLSKPYIGFPFVNEFSPKLLQLPTKRFKIINLHTCLISLSPISQQEI